MTCFHPFLCAALVCLCAIGCIAPGMAAYPERPIRLVVPVAAGGGNDIIARLLARKLTEAWGVQVVVDNRPGAATAIGADIVAKANPDGYTIMLTSASFAINAAMHPKLPFDPIRDFSPLTLAARVPQILLANAALPVQSVAELLKLAKAKPGQLNYGSAGTGSLTHLAMELFMEMSGVSLTHVPYKGTSPALADLVAGHVQVIFDAIPPTFQLIKSGRVKALAVATPTRFPSIPNVPTMAESGLPEYSFSSWFAIMAPARVPAPIVTRINHELVRIIHEPQIKEQFIGLGVEPLGTSPEELGRHMRKEIELWRQVIQRHHIRAD